MPKRSKKAKSKYSPHPGLSQEAADKERLEDETGRSFDEWVAVARREGPRSQAACREWLQKTHGHGMRNAWWLASVATATESEPNYSEPEGLVDALYCGAKSAWRPLHEKVVDAALSCGSDVLATSCKTMVPIYRKHVFAELKPVADGVELQLALGEGKKAKGFEPIDRRDPGARLTHRRVLRSVADLDAPFADALQVAYENGAGRMARAAEAKTPSDLARALKASSKAAATWESCTDAMRRDWIVWIDSAKQDATRVRRIGQTIAKLAAGKRKMY
jgi:bacteriocin resistance YdeI/OmpD-like protein/uncharacterized protein DUF5655